MPSQPGIPFSFFRTVRGRLVLLACLATLPAFFFVLFMAAQERDAALRQAERDAWNLASIASREHAHQVMGAKRLLQRLAEDYRTEALSFPMLDRLLPAVLRGFPQFANLGMLTPEGSLRFSVVPPTRVVDMRKDPAFRGALAGPDVAFGHYEVGQIVGRPVLLLAQALRDPSGKVLGVLFVALDLAWLDELSQQARLPKGFSLLLADREGRVLAGTRAGGPQVAQKGDLLPEFGPLREPSPVLNRRVGKDGVPYLLAVSTLEGVPDLYVAVGVPEQQVVGQANRIYLRAIGVLLALTLLTVASSIAVADLSVLREARLLARATRRFGEGDLAVRAPIPASLGEFRELAEAFNGMADALAQRHQQTLDAQEQLRALSNRIQSAREEEGTRIARELHDQLGQELTALKLDLARVRRQLVPTAAGADGGSVGASMDQMTVQIDHCIDSIRRIASELRPSVLDRLGLGAALERLSRDFEQRTAVPCSTEGCEASYEISPEVATTLFRVAQEAFTNIARHAKAQAVHLSLAEEGSDLVLTIQDDGVGLPAQAGAGTLGLLGMHERVRLVGGQLAVQNAHRQGTQVVARVPRNQG